MNRTRSTKNIALLAALLLLVLSALSACTNKTNADEAKETESKVGTSAEAQAAYIMANVWRNKYFKRNLLLH